MNTYDYAVFDLDGTLLDTRESILSAAKYTMRQFGREIPDPATLDTMIGPPLHASFQRFFGLSDAGAKEMANCYRKEYIKDKCLFRAAPYAGIFDLLEALTCAGVAVGVATYKREDCARKLLCHFGFDRYTAHMFGADADGVLTKADIIRICLDAMGCGDRSRAVYIGDGAGDGQGAQAVGTDFIAVTYGFGFKPGEPVGCPHIGIAAQPEEVIPMILKSDAAK